MKNGVLIALLSYATFSWGDACIKASRGGMSVFQIGFLVAAAAAFFLFFAHGPEERWRDFWRTKRPWLVQARAITGSGAGILGVYAFTTIPMAEAYSLIFLSPFFVTLLSTLILKEQIGPWRWGAVFAGFCGVLLVVRPGFRELSLGHLAALGIAFLTATTVILLRSLSRTEKRTTILGVMMIYALVINAAGMMLTGAKVPSVREISLVLAAGAFSACGQVLLLQAMKLAPANHVAPTQYSQIAWAAAIGAAVFQEYPDRLAIVGLVIVALAGLTTLIREKTRLGKVR
ncbi:DMT family transporter [Neorhizobium alkalisoli]|uniref:DMT family transporter n=1 Tax=Neorhizobium alkalisoli TaxID=528178 RepID=UPI000CF95A69|nr:DMT family transporter [Neorhizobium alkalisoli]